MTIILATGNAGKLSEVREILPKYDFITLKDIGFDRDIEENGSTYEENALIKVRAVWDFLDRHDRIIMADDSGLEIDYLNGEPGIHSARYMGYDTPYSVKNQAIIDALAGVPDEKRGARYVCAIAIKFPDGTESTVRGIYEGKVAYEAKGTNGFGYDPMFWVPAFGKTDGELPIEIKNKMSHRAKALRAADELIRERKITP